MHGGNRWDMAENIVCATAILRQSWEGDLLKSA